MTDEAPQVDLLAVLVEQLALTSGPARLEQVNGVIRLDRSLLRGEDRVWVMGADGRLQIRNVAIPFRGADSVLVTDGLAAGEQLVTTDLAAPVEGMVLRSDSDALPAAAAGP